MDKNQQFGTQFVLTPKIQICGTNPLEESNFVQF